jgi:hypothetical protein
MFVDVTDVRTMSATALREVIRPSIKAVMTTHMWGIPCDMVALQEVPKDCPFAHRFFSLRTARMPMAQGLRDNQLEPSAMARRGHFKARRFFLAEEVVLWLPKHQEFNSMCLLHDQPLFTNPKDVLPAVHPENLLTANNSG